KYDYVSSKPTICTTITNNVGTEGNGTGGGNTFESIVAASDITIPQLIKELALAPADASGYEGDYFHMNNTAEERVPIRGGSWSDGRYAGVFLCSLSYARSHSRSIIGFRSAYYEGL
ncbi:MAG: hypothetical protein ACI3XC_00490, partial [Phascolarctobacterium sp.]